VAKAILFTGGSVFDGTAFLAPGTSVLVSGDRVTAVGTGLDAGGANIVDLAGGTLLPGFLDAHAHPVLSGATRAAWQYPFGDLVASGAHLAAGSDWPVSSPDPLLGIHVAVNRALPETADDPFLPGQAIGRETALTAYTSGTALVNGVSGSAGRIRRGYDASFAITDADLTAIADHEICAASVTQTWVQGEHAYQEDRMRRPEPSGTRPAS
jgi:predicted amidohydrolase YtcJ